MSEVDVKVRRSIDALEGILAEFDGFFITRSDKLFVEELLASIFYMAVREAGKAADSEAELQEGLRMEPYKIPPHRFNAKVLDVLYRIQDHASYRRAHDEVRYRVGKAFLTREDFIGLVSSYDGHEFSNYESDRFLKSLLRFTGDFSARKVAVFEKIVHEIELREAEHKSGVIFFDKAERVGPREYANRLICAILGKSASEHVSIGDVLEIRARYSMGGRVFLTELKGQIKAERVGHIRGVNEIAFGLLEQYLNAINPESYEIDGLNKATPKIVRGSRNH